METEKIVKKQTPKRGGGQPTKFKGSETIAHVEAVIKRLQGEPSAFLSVCGMEQLADGLGVHRDTLYEWAKVHPEFSDTIKSWMTARNAAFYRTAKALPPGIWIFLAKNWLGMRDRQTIELPGEDRLEFKFAAPALTVNVVHTQDGEGAPAGTLTPHTKPAGELSDAELEAEIARLQREERNDPA